MEIAIKNEMLIPTKSELKEMATQLTEGVASGFDDALRVFGQLSALAEVIEQAKNIVKPMGMDVTSKLKRQVSNMTIQAMSTGDNSKRLAMWRMQSLKGTKRHCVRWANIVRLRPLRL